MAPGSIYLEKTWLKHYDDGVPPTIDYEPVCMPEYLDRTTARFPDKTALIFQGYKISYRDLKLMVDAFAACLTGFGIGPGDRVALLLPNVIPCVAAYFATLKLGAIAVMNNPLYSDRELEHQFTDSGAKLLVTLDLLGNRMIDLRPKTGIKQIIYTSIGDYLPFPKSLLFPLVAKKKKLAADVKPAQELYKWKDVLKTAGPAAPGPKLTFDDVAMYQYTGGTTGVSKGVMLTHGNLSVQVQQGAAWFPDFKPGEVTMLGALPFFHIFGITTTMNLSVRMGWTDVLVPKPQPEQLMEAINKFQPTFAPLVPTMYMGILNHPGVDHINMTSIRGCFSGSAPLPVEVIKNWESRTGANIAEGFGLTESSPVLTINPFNGMRKAGSIGVPVSDTEVRIVDLVDGKTDMPVGEIGEIVARGPQVMKGYWNQPEETAETLKDGWLHTGDIGKMDEDGYFYVVDRLKDMIIVGGCNAYPRDIEEVYYEHPKVLEAAAIGVPHETRGEVVKLFVALKEGETGTEQEFIDFAKDKLARYKWPNSVVFKPELPKSNVGKILKKELRD